jgi:hypothetical protein
MCEVSSPTALFEALLSGLDIRVWRKFEDEAVPPPARLGKLLGELSFVTLCRRRKCLITDVVA